MWCPRAVERCRSGDAYERAPDKRLKIVFEHSHEGGFIAVVPVLPGCISEGDTLDEARVNIREAIELYLEARDDHANGELPTGTVIEELVV